MRMTRRQMLEYAAVVAVTLAIVLFAFIQNPDTMHWFAIPICICGFLTGADAIKAFRPDSDLMDPEIVIGTLSYHFFFLTPLLHVMWDMATLRWVPDEPSEWRIWFGYMGIINILGILAYRWCKALGLKGRRRRPPGSVPVRPKTLLACLPLAMTISVIAQVYVLRSVGGLSRLLVIRETGTAGALKGMGWLLVLSESLPILCFMTVMLAKLTNVGNRSKHGNAFVWLLLLIPLQFVWGGLRGSRSATVWVLFWAVGIIHYLWKPLRKSQVIIGLVALMVFMYGYGFYKTAGVAVLDMVAMKTPLGEMELLTGRTMRSMILGDLGRANVQALLLYRQISCPEQATISWGATYLSDLAQFVPKNLWRNRPQGKGQIGTEWLYGRGTYVYEQVVSSRVYGLAGNAMFNFGFVSIPILYGLWGFVVGRYCRYLKSLEPGDTAYMLAPLWTMLLFSTLFGDLDNLIVLAVMKGMVPCGIYMVAQVLERRFARHGASPATRVYSHVDSRHVKRIPSELGSDA